MVLPEYDARTFNIGLRYSYWSGGFYATIPLVNFESFAHKPDYRIGKGASIPFEEERAWFKERKEKRQAKRLAK